jgi:hypothetical protein
VTLLIKNNIIVNWALNVTQITASGVLVMLIVA